MDKYPQWITIHNGFFIIMAALGACVARRGSKPTHKKDASASVTPEKRLTVTTQPKAAIVLGMAAQNATLATQRRPCTLGANCRRRRNAEQLRGQGEKGKKLRKKMS